MSRLVHSLPAGALLVGALLLAGCGGSGPDSSSSSSTSVGAASVIQAADVTDLTPGYRFQMSMDSSVEGHSVNVNGEGAIDDHGKRGETTIDVSGKKFSEIIDSPYIYVEVPGKTSSHWVKADLNAFTQSLGAGNALGGSSASPTAMLKYLKAAGQVSLIGHEAIRGTPTTHYRATIDFDRYGKVLAKSSGADAGRYAAMMKRMTGSSSLPMDVWVDESKRVRRIGLTMHICTAEGPLQESMTMNLYGYGQPLQVSAPPSSGVPDITSELKSTLAAGLQKLGC